MKLCPLWLFAIIFCFFALPSTYAADAPMAKAAYSKAWLRLGVWRAHADQYQSEQDAPHFFLSSHGSVDPEQELKATLSALSQPQQRLGMHTEPAACVYPARRLVLERFGYRFPEVTCPKWQAFRDHYDLQGVTLVYASAYANNPASMAGHVFLKLDAKRHASIKGEGGLLDHSLGFLAHTSADDNAAIYTLRGIFGGYYGTYRIEPYSQTHEIYANGDMRDLWEFELRLSPQQSELLVAHIWELYQFGKFDYYFFDENCAYRILTLLEGVFPDAELISRLNFPVLPIDTVRAVESELGPYHAVRFRPSLMKSVQHSVALVSDESEAAMRDILQGKLPPSHISDAYALDAVIAQLNYKKYLSSNQLEPSERDLLRTALLRRAQIPIPAVPIPAPPLTERPDYGHRSRRVGVGMERYGKDDISLLLSFKPGLHDLLAPDVGYDPYAAINYFDVTFAAAHKKSPKIKRLTVAEVMSLMPLTKVAPDFSWRFGLFSERAAAHKPLIGRAEGGVGLTWSTPARSVAAYGLALAVVTTPIKMREEPSRIGPAALSGVLIRKGSIKFLGEIRSQRLFDFNQRGSTLNSINLAVSSALNIATELRGEVMWQKINTDKASKPALNTNLYYYF